jgi:hypothetical protein
MKTTERLSKAEAGVKASFRLADARTSLAIKFAPPEPRTPAQLIAFAVEKKAVQDNAAAAAESASSTMSYAVNLAKKEIEAVADEASGARHLANYIEARCDDLPASVPETVITAAMAVRGQKGAAMLARKLRLAAENAEAEVDRLQKRWLPRVELASKIAGHNQARRIFKAAGLERKARAAELWGIRLEAQRHKMMEDAARERLSGRGF